MDAIAHLAGCDLRHTSRQRCSSWEPPTEPEPVVTASPPRSARSSETRDSELKRPTKWGWFWLTLVSTAIVWIPTALLSSVILVVAYAWALDGLGWVDNGDPNYIREARPDSATLVKRTEILGNGVVDGVVFWFYANDAPFSEIEQHYEARFTEEGLERTTMWRPWNTDEPGIAFQDPDDHQRCIRMVRFTPEYDLQDFSYSYMTVNTSALREEMLASREPYVVQFSTGCGG